MELRGEDLGRAGAEGLLDELAGLAALRAGEAPGPDGRLALRADGDLDDLIPQLSGYKSNRLNWLGNGGSGSCGFCSLNA